MKLLAQIQKKSENQQQMIASYQNLVRKLKNAWLSRSDEVNDELKQYWSYRDELSNINGVIFKSDRVIIPKKLRSEMLIQLHIQRMGIEKIKLRARESMFCPFMNREIEDMVKLCNICIKNQSKQEKKQQR